MLLADINPVGGDINPVGLAFRRDINPVGVAAGKPGRLLTG